MLSSGGRVDALGRPTAAQGLRHGICPIGQPCAALLLRATGAAWNTPSRVNARPTTTPTLATASLLMRPQVAVSDSGPTSAGLSPDEEEAYQELMEKRKAERKAWKQEMRRRAKFDPMAVPKKASASAAPAAPTPATAPVAPAPAPLPPLSRPRPPAAAAASPPLALPTSQPQPPSAATLRANLPRPAPPPVGPPAGAARKAQAAAAAVAADDDEDDDDELDLDGMAAMARKLLEEGDDDDNDEEADEEASSPAKGRASSGAGTSTSRAGPAAGAVHMGAAGVAALRRPGAPAPKRALMPISQLQRQRAVTSTEAAGSAASAAAAVRAAAAGRRPVLRPAPSAAPSRGGEEGEVEGAAEEDDGLDWDALEAYEKYEQYVNEAADEEQRAARAAARRASASTASTSAARSGAAAAKPATATPASAAATARSRKAAAPSADPSDKLDAQLDSWEQLLNFFEVVEKDGKREDARRRQREAEQEAAEEAQRDEEDEGEEGRGRPARSSKSGKQVRAAVRPGAKKQAGSKGAVAAAAAGGASLAAELAELGLTGSGDDDEEAQGEVEVDWQSVERLFLGDGWESELADLKAKVEAGAREVEAAMAAQEGGEEAQVEPWRDEVSTLLLGLVEISAKRYLGRSLLADTPAAAAAAAAAAAVAAGVVAVGAAAASPLGEEERAAAFWEAPFMLLVQDDSADPQLEYANRAALAALGLASFDDATAGLSAAGLVDPAHPQSQQEWLWACTEAAERAERFSSIPSLRLRGPGSSAPVARCRGVTVFRVDSLEGEPIGQAAVVEAWRPAAAGEADEDSE